MRIVDLKYWKKRMVLESNSDIKKAYEIYDSKEYDLSVEGVFTEKKVQEIARLFNNVTEVSISAGGEFTNDYIYKLNNLKSFSYNNINKEIDLGRLPQLRFLGFGYSKKNIKNLCSQTSLQKLSVSDYSEKDMNALSCLTSIKEFTTIGGKMKSLDGIQHLTNLEKLEISAHRSLTDISQIAALKNLNYLEINTCWKLADFSPIGKLKNLKQLEIIDCKNLGSIKFIKDMPNLKSLNTSGTTIINDYDTTPAEHVPVFWGSQYNKYNKQYPEKEIRDIKLENL